MCSVVACYSSHEILTCEGLSAGLAGAGMEKAKDRLTGMMAQIFSLLCVLCTYFTFPQKKNFLQGCLLKQLRKKNLLLCSSCDKTKVMVYIFLMLNQSNPQTSSFSCWAFNTKPTSKWQNIINHVWEQQSFNILFFYFLAKNFFTSKYNKHKKKWKHFTIYLLRKVL